MLGMVALKNGVTAKQLEKALLSRRPETRWKKLGQG